MGSNCKRFTLRVTSSCLVGELNCLRFVMNSENFKYLKNYHHKTSKIVKILLSYIIVYLNKDTKPFRSRQTIIS